MEVNHRINLFGANTTTQNDIPLYSIDHPYNLLAGEKAASLMEMDMAKRVTLSREELFDQVWRKPIREVAVELGVSDVGLAKKCLKNGIPFSTDTQGRSRRSMLNRLHRRPSGGGFGLTRIRCRLGSGGKDNDS